MEEKVQTLKDQGFYEKTRNTNALGELEIVMYRHDAKVYTEVILKEVR